MVVVGCQDGHVIIFDLKRQQPSSSNPSSTNSTPNTTPRSSTYNNHQHSNNNNSLSSFDLNITTGHEEEDLLSPTIVFKGKTDNTSIRCVQFDPFHPHILATLSENGTLCIWDLTQSEHFVSNRRFNFSSQPSSNKPTSQKKVDQQSQEDIPATITKPIAKLRAHSREVRI